MTASRLAGSAARRCATRLFVPDMPTRSGSDGGARDPIGVQMVPGVRQLSSLARGTDRFLRPSQAHGGLSDVEGSGSVLEHLWNKTFVDRRGWLVNQVLRRCLVPRMISKVGEEQRPLVTR